MIRQLPRLLAGLVLALGGWAHAQPFGVQRELFTGLSTTDNSYPATASFTNSAPNPAYTRVFTNFETEVNFLDGYGQRLRGFLIPPTHGNYVFWIASDDWSDLYLGTDEAPNTRARIANVSAWTNPREWAKEVNQQSSPRFLEGGRRYYIEALMKEGAGGDNLAVRWQTPDGTIEEPIPAVGAEGAPRLIPYFTNRIAAPGLLREPVSLTVEEGATVSFSVLATNQSPLVYRWQLHGTNLAGATRSVHSVTNVTVARHDGSRFRCVITNSAGSLTSVVATLTVLPDTTPPTLLSAANLSPTNVMVGFSEPVEPGSATNLLNYSLSGGVTISGVSLADPASVLLIVSPLVMGSNYTLTVNGVRDRASVPNAIAENSRIPFVAREFASGDVGQPFPPGVTVVVSNGLNLTAGGSDIGGNSDQFHFDYQLRGGDFDVQVRLQALSAADTWSKAGLMARESLTANSRFAAVLAVPSLAGMFFETRNTPGAVATLRGAFPAPFPNAWLRLKRVGNTFSGYASLDAENWHPLGSLTLALGPVYLGMAVSSHLSGVAATAQFRDFGAVAGGTIGAVPLPFEPLGPCTRRTPMVITEIMYRPAPRLDGKDLEFIELFNSNPYFEDIGGWRLSGDVDYTFPAGTRIPAQGFLVLAKAPADVAAHYGLANVLGYGVPQRATNALGEVTTNLVNGLNASGGTVRLHNEQGAVYLEIPFSSDAPWPVAANGTGHSIVLARPSYGERDAQAWAISDTVGGSPGRAEPYAPDPLRGVVINEFLANSDSPWVDYIELYNHSHQPQDVSGCVLSDDPVTNKFIIPAGTVIPPRQFVVFEQAQLGFGLSAGGETLFFKNADRTRVLDAVQYEAQAINRATGRAPDGAEEFYPLQSRSPGAPNDGMWISDVVINEIMYDPISRDSADEYVELYNQGAAPVDLGGWRFTHGIGFTFPSNTVIAPGAFLVVAKDRDRLIAQYPQLSTLNTVGDFDGALAGEGERLALARPEISFATNSRLEVVTNLAYVVMDEVTYKAGGHWGNWAHGGGSSLELLDPRADHRLAYNWADSDETAKAPWTTIQASGPMDNGTGTANLLELGLHGEGECLVDNVEVIAGAGANLITNSTFEIGAGGWVARGNHVRSSLETTEGSSSRQSLHVRASSRVDYGANRVLTTLRSVPTGTVTIRAQARWLKGWPELLLRLHGNYFEAFGRLPLPPNLGTPGLRNSRALSNAPPAIYAVSHSPLVPAAGQPVVVTARVHDPDGLAGLVLKFRLDPNTNYTSVTLLDDGTAGDALARDGVFSATIPGQATNALVAFLVQATDTRGAGSVFPAGASPLGREGLVRFGDPTPASSFGTYRQWFTQRAVNSWINRPVLSNEPVEGTFVYGDFRAIYNFTSRYAGSPYHQSWAGPTSDCHYSMEMPGDDLLLGTANFNKVHAPGNGPFDDATLQREQAAYWIGRQLGIPWPNRRFVNMLVNGVARRAGLLMEDMHVPGDDMVESYYPGQADGTLHKLQPWFEMEDAASGSMSFVNASWCTLNRYVTTVSGQTNQHKIGRYRVNYLTRNEQGTAYDFTNVLALVEAANTPTGGPFVANLEAIADMEHWMRVFAVEHAAGNWDAVGSNNEQNMYGYKPPGGKWRFFIFDFNIVLGNSGSWGPGPENLFTYNQQNLPGQPNGNPPMGRIYGEPAFRRAYLRAFRDIANGPMLAANLHPMLDAKFAAFQANGLTAASPAPIKDYVSTMRNSLLTALNTERAANIAFTVAGATQVTVTSNQLVLSGTAPIEAKSITVNGASWPLTWTTISNWATRVSLASGTNALTIEARDLQGRPLPGASKVVTAVFAGNTPDPRGVVFISEIMFDPAVPDAEYIELFNRSGQHTFDLSGWRLSGVDYVFPDGALLAPQRPLVLAKDYAAFANAHGTAVSVFDFFRGNLQRDGETLTLIQPGPAPGEDVVVDRVRYEGAWPWSPDAWGTGASLQLLDPAAHHARPGNWFSHFHPAVFSPELVSPPVTNTGWRMASLTTNMGNSKMLYLYLDAAGEVYVDDLSLVSGAQPGVGVNYIRKGDFEIDDATLTNTFSIGVNYTNSSISTTVKHSGNASLRLVSTSPPSGTNRIILQVLDPAPTNGERCTLSFWYLTTTNAGSLVARVPNSSLNITTNVQPFVTPATYVPPQLLIPPQMARTPGSNNFIYAPLENFTPIEIPSSSAPQPALLYPSKIQASGFDARERISRVSVQLRGLSHAVPDDLHILLVGPNGAATLLMANCGGTFPVTNLTLRFDDASASLPDNARIGSGSFRPTAIDPTNLAAPAPPMPYTTNLGVFNGTSPNGDWSLYVMDDRAGEGGRVWDGWMLFLSTTNFPTLPPLWLNEAQTINHTGLTDSAGEREPWLELFNAGSNVVALEGLYLSSDYSNLTQWAFPAGASLAPGEFKVLFADGQPAQTTAAEWHLPFRLPSLGGSLALSTVFGGQARVLDYLNVPALPADVSYGSWPDGQPFDRRVFYYATPGRPNDGAAPPLRVFLNEWMASNTRFLADPADGDFDDWFEIYNPGSEAVDLAGYFLTDTVDNWNQFRIPSGYAIAPGGFLLVWADNELNQNSTNRRDLHANFQLNRAGEDLWLFSPDSNLVDHVRFEAQTNDVSQGRWPDGAASLFFMSTPTPRASNVVVLGNTPPRLAAIPDQVIDEMKALTVPLAATDADPPPQRLTFSLAPPVPSGARVVSNGFVRWVPSEAHGPGVYPITVRVTDDGVPPSNSTTTFAVTVREVNRPPSFSHTLDKHVKAGELLRFRTATDPDLPPQSVLFQLAADAPAGAFVGLSTGEVVWTPTDAQAPGTYALTVTAEDDGVPALRASHTYQVHVYARDYPLVVVEATRTGGNLQLSWRADIGATYAVESRAVWEAAWLMLGTPIVATSQTVTVFDPLTDGPARFYRVRKVE